MHREIAQIVRDAGAETIAAAFYDYETETSWSFRGDRWFHAASTIKVALLVSLFAAIEEGQFNLESRLHVRNRFFSIVDGTPYRIETSRDSNSEVHAALGKNMQVGELAYHMIVTSSNLATNLLLDLVGLEAAQATLSRLKLEGVQLKRGVEDERAFEAGISNEVTAHGLLRLFRAIMEDQTFSAAARQKMIEILGEQKFNSGIPAGLPEKVRATARIAHKTGEISTVAHDAGLVYLPERKPYAVAILTEWPPNTSNHQETVARVSQVIYEHLINGGGNDDH